MQTSQQWWDSIKNNDDLLIAWLKTQYHGERTAFERIIEVMNKFTGEIGAKMAYGLSQIAGQESQHAYMIGCLLEARGVEAVKLSEHETRYWAKVFAEGELPDNLDDLLAIGAHAEEMRLARIEVIAADPETPEDIRQAFAIILPEERWHAKWFREFASDEAYDRTNAAHVAGLNALGLVV